MVCWQRPNSSANATIGFHILLGIELLFFGFPPLVTPGTCSPWGLSKGPPDALGVNVQVTSTNVSTDGYSSYIRVPGPFHWQFELGRSGLLYYSKDTRKRYESLIDGDLAGTNCEAFLIKVV